MDAASRPGGSGRPKFDSLRAWSHGSLPERDIPTEWTLAAMEQAGVAVGLACASGAWPHILPPDVDLPDPWTPSPARALPLREEWPA